MTEIHTPSIFLYEYDADDLPKAHRRNSRVLNTESDVNSIDEDNDVCWKESIVK